jgi:hypothetical protein
VKELSVKQTEVAPGSTFIEVRNAVVVQDGPMTIRCWFSKEDNCYLASLHDAEQDDRPFHATHTAHGDTPEQALAHLAIAEYVLALAVASGPTREGE